MALGAGVQVTPEQVDHARVSLCQAAAFPQSDGDTLVNAAIAQYGENRPEATMAISKALFEYMTDQWKNCGNPTVNKRLFEVLHEPHENEMGAGS